MSKKIYISKNKMSLITEAIQGDLSLLNSIEYIKKEYNDDEEPYTEYELEGITQDGDTLFYATVTADELTEYMPQEVANMVINDEGRDVNGYIKRIDDILYLNTKAETKDEINNLAKKLSSKNGESIFILEDGDIVSFYDHMAISSIDGMNVNKFVSLGNIRVGNGGFELCQEPTQAQWNTLARLFRNNDVIYVDIAKVTDKGNYPNVVESFTCSTFNDVYRRVCTYFGGNIEETTAKLKKVHINENKIFLLI